MDDHKESNNNNWQCQKCTLINNVFLPYCEGCRTPTLLQQRKDNKNPYIDDTLINAQNTYSPLQNEQYLKQYEINKNFDIWECKLCSMKNSKYMPRCEICLIDKDIQENDEILQEFIKTNLNNKQNQNNQHIKADDILQLIQKLQDDLKKFKQNKQKIQKEIESVYERINIKCDTNFAEKFIKSMDNEEFIEQKELHRDCHPICKCGQEMEQKTADCYNGISHYKYTICDICNDKMKNNDTIYHCTKKQLKGYHPDGFDICLKCRKQHIHRLRYFVALIICPKMTNGTHNGKDAITLIKMFNKLGFHKIICLDQEEQLTKENIQNTFNEHILPKQYGNNVNQFTVICYSGHGGWKNNEYFFQIKPKDPKTWISADDMRSYAGSNVHSKQKLKSIYKSTTDGLTKYLNEYWYKKYFKYNTLWLINSCHSGGFPSNLNPARSIAESFVSTSLFSILCGVFGLSISYVRSFLATMTEICDEGMIQSVQYMFTTQNVMYFKQCLRLGLSAKLFTTIAIAAGVAIITVIIVCIIIYKASKKSEECESTYIITSCQENEESIGLQISPFIKHCNHFFDIYLDQKVNQSSTPDMLYSYLERAYKIKDDDLGHATLEYLKQNVYAASKGFKQFAMCPKFSNTTQ